MNDIHPRLTRCFQDVFPQLSAEAAAQASMDTLEPWDSIALVTLINVVEEEFQVQVEPDEFPDLITYQGFVNYLTKAASNGQ